MPKILIGHVAVDSGQIIMIDPCYEGEDLAAHPEKTNQLVFAKNSITAAVLFDTEVGDGMFPVYAHRNKDGELTKIVISLGE